ncbi:hypothetical protein, partial [Staphylococcus pasteuri_A]
VDWTGLSADSFASDAFRTVRFGALQPGWSRFVAELTAPLAVQTAALDVADDKAGAQLTVTLKSVDRAAFDAAIGSTPDA